MLARDDAVQLGGLEKQVSICFLGKESLDVLGKEGSQRARRLLMRHLDSGAGVIRLALLLGSKAIPKDIVITGQLPLRISLALIPPASRAWRGGLVRAMATHCYITTAVQTEREEQESSRAAWSIADPLVLLEDFGLGVPSGSSLSPSEPKSRVDLRRIT